MENRNGLCLDILVTELTQAEHRAARSMLTRARRRRIHPKMLGADKGETSLVATRSKLESLEHRFGYQTNHEHDPSPEGWQIDRGG